MTYVTHPKNDITDIISQKSVLKLIALTESNDTPHLFQAL